MVHVDIFIVPVLASWAVDYWANMYRNLAQARGVAFENGLVNDGGVIELDREAFIEANDFYMALMTFSPPGILSWGYPESKEGLGNGTVAMSMQWATSVFRDPRHDDAGVYERRWQCRCRDLVCGG